MLTTDLVLKAASHTLKTLTEVRSSSVPQQWQVVGLTLRPVSGLHHAHRSQGGRHLRERRRRGDGGEAGSRRRKYAAQQEDVMEPSGGYQ